MKKFKIYKIVLFVFILSTFIFYSSCIANSKTINTLELIKNIEYAYQNLDAYYDKGKIFEKYMITEFETHYKNKIFFLFEWNSYIRSKNIAISKSWICMNEDKIILYDTFGKKKKIVKFNEFNKVISHSYADSRGALGNIAPLLFKDFKIRSLTSLKNPQIVGKEIIDKENCIHLILKQKGPNTTIITIHLWVIENSYLIKKIKRIHSELETTYFFETINTNIDISDKIFEKQMD